VTDMRTRKIDGIAFVENVPVSATCSQCGAVFRIADPDLATNRLLALEKIVNDFDAHECSRETFDSRSN
jgi:hypothetical protein